MNSSVAMEIYAGLGAAAALGLAAGGCAYASLYPGSRIFGNALIAPRRAGEIALTFDDGPNMAWTPRLLDLLAEHNVKVTFFMLGSRAEQEPELVRRVAAEGHLIGSHSWSHPNLARTAAGLVREELTRTSAVLEQITGERVRYFRPPFGARRPMVLRAARELGLTPVMWNVTGFDWDPIGVDGILGNLERGIAKNRQRGCGSNLLLHDGGHRGMGAARMDTVRAVERLLDAHAGTETRFVTVDAWAKAEG